MPSLSDVGKVITIVYDREHYGSTSKVLVTMVIKGPKGSCAIYDNLDGPMNHNLRNKGKAIKAFMEFNNA